MNGDFELRHWRPRPRPRPKSLTIPVTLSLLDSSPLSPSANGDFIVYTSLCEIMTPKGNGGVVNSPTAAEIMIRNRLVKQAAYAYLQPTPSSTEGSSRRRRGSSLRRALSVIESCFGFIGSFLRSIRSRKLYGGDTVG